MASRLSSNHLLISALAKRQRSKNPLQAGFTLVELLIVVIIIGILGAIAVPGFLNQQGRARINSSQTAVISAARACAAAQVTGEHGSFVAPTNVSSVPATCPAAGTSVVFTSTGFTNGGTEAAATVSATGAVALSTCAQTAGWVNPAANLPACTPTRG